MHDTDVAELGLLGPLPGLDGPVPLCKTSDFGPSAILQDPSSSQIFSFFDHGCFLNGCFFGGMFLDMHGYAYYAANTQKLRPMDVAQRGGHDGEKKVRISSQG